jgi:hypothetical protein
VRTKKEIIKKRFLNEIKKISKEIGKYHMVYIEA